MNCRVLRIFGTFSLVPLLTLTLLPLEAEAQRARIGRGDRDLVTTKLAALKKPVIVHLYTGGGNVNKTRQTSALLDFMEESSGKISVIRYDMDKEPSLKTSLGVDHGPVMALKGEKFQGHSYYGLPSQMELEPFLDGILIAAGQGQRPSPQAASFLSKLEEEVHIRVFVTPD
jgi:thioredoxin-like negative regulator of GroEL